MKLLNSFLIWNLWICNLKSIIKLDKLIMIFLKLFITILIILSIIPYSFGQRNEIKNAKLYWTKEKIYNDSNQLSLVIKKKRLFIINFSTLNLQGYLKIKKYYKNGVLISKEYYTITDRGCKARILKENKVKRRFPYFLFYRIKFFVLGNFGMKFLL